MESYLLTLPAIRQRSFNLFEQAQKGHLQYFDYNQQNELLVANYCVDLIKVCLLLLLLRLLTITARLWFKLLFYTSSWSLEALAYSHSFNQLLVKFTHHRKI